MTYLTIKTLKPEWKKFSLESAPELNEYASFHRFKIAQVIFYEGHLPYGLFILISGEVEFKYRDNKTERISEPSFFGISAFNCKKPFSGTLITISECEFYFLGFSAYQDLKGSLNPIQTWIKKYI